MNKGTIIEWTSTDEEGKFSHVGIIKSYDDEMVVMEDTNGGEIAFPVEDGDMKILKKLPKDFGPDKNYVRRMKAGNKPTPKPARKKRVRKSNGTSKKEQALIIYRDIVGKGHGKKTCIQRFQDVLDMSLSGATTYFYNCKKIEGY